LGWGGGGEADKLTCSLNLKIVNEKELSDDGRIIIEKVTYFPLIRHGTHKNLKKEHMNWKHMHTDSGGSRLPES
jgi:hypothetical protein